MGLKIVLNEVSLFNPDHDVRTANQLMSDLLDTIRKVSHVGGNSGIEFYATENLFGLFLTSKYTVSSWLSRQKRDEREYFLRIIKKPFVDDIAVFNDEEFLFQGKSVESLGRAFRKGALAVSLRSELCWDQSSLQIEHHYLVDDDNEIAVDLVDVKHASTTEHVQEHASWIRDSRQAEVLHLISDEVALWEHREKFFPNLPFCSSVKKSLLKKLRGSSMFEHVVEALSKLDKYCEDWHIGPFDEMEIACRISGESEATLQKYGEERTFLCPDGITRTFSWHVKLANGWRIYFEPWIDPLADERRQLVIGSIGPHPANVTNPT